MPLLLFSLPVPIAIGRLLYLQLWSGGALLNKVMAAEACDARMFNSNPAAYPIK
ncbi:hypothetical protein BH10BAC2_BH10BAC2_49000 [soil metagenome]